MPTPSNSMNLHSTTPGLVNWDGNSLMNTTALTQYNTLVGASADTIQNIAPGTAGQVLTSNGGVAYPSFQNAGGGSSPTYFNYTSSLINFKVVGTTDIFTVAPAARFSFIFVTYTQVTSVAANYDYLLNLGWTAVNYDDLLSGFTFNGLAPGRNYTISLGSSILYVTGPNTIKVNITSADTGTTLQGYVSVQGFYF